MKNLILASVAAASLGTASLALAGGPDQPINTPAPKGGMYAGIGLGVGSLDMPSDISSDAIVSNQDQKNNMGLAGRLDVGYLMDVRSNMLVGAELGYNYLPQTKYTVTYDDANGTVNNEYKYTQYSVDALGVAKYLMQNGFDIFGKAGVAYVKQTAKLTSGNSAVSKDHLGKILPEVALGAGYAVNSNVEATFTYAHVFGDDIDQVSDVTAATASNINGQVVSSNTFLFGVDYKFDV